jgi:hypothetical protein
MKASSSIFDNKSKKCARVGNAWLEGDTYSIGRKSYFMNIVHYSINFLQQNVFDRLLRGATLTKLL